MKKFIMIFIAVSFLSGCKSWDATMLSVPKEEISPKLVSLERQIDDMANTTVIANNDELKVFTQEVEENLTDPYGDKYGYIVLKRSIIKVKSGMGYMLSSAFLACIPNLFGFPLMKLQYKIEVEIRILDRDRKLIAKYSSIGESKVIVAMYYGYSAANAYRKAYPEALIDAFNKIRPQIKKDASELNKKLIEAGKL